MLKKQAIIQTAIEVTKPGEMAAEDLTLILGRPAQEKYRVRISGLY